MIHVQGLACPKTCFKKIGRKNQIQGGFDEKKDNGAGMYSFYADVCKPNRICPRGICFSVPHI